MAITLTGGSGLFDRWGKIILGARAINGVRGKTNPSPSSAWGASGPTIACADTIWSGILGTINTIPGQQVPSVAQLFPNELTFQNSCGTVLPYFQGLAGDILTYMAEADTPLPTINLLNAMTLLNTQMVANSNTIKGNTTSVSVSAGGSNVGNPTVIASVVNTDGRNLQFPIPETLVLTTTRDVPAGATAGAETLTPTSTAINDGGPLDWKWPTGSGTSPPTLTMCNDSIDATPPHLLTNSDFENWTGSPASLNNWTKLTGVWGTDILKNTSTVHRGSSALSFVGDGSTHSSICQTFANGGFTTGTSTKLLPSTVYAFSIWVRMAAAPAAGVLAVDLIDGSSTIQTNAQGVNQQKTFALTGIAGNTWTNVTGFFQTPAVLPSQIQVRVWLSTALTNATTVFIDDFAFMQAVQLYTGGPFVAVFRGTTDTLNKDLWNITVSNDYGGQFMSWTERFFGMRAGTCAGITLPFKTDGSQSIADTLCF